MIGPVRRALVLLALLASSCGGGDGGGAGVSIASPGDGATVESPVAVTMEAEGLVVEAAGEAREGAGHFHLIVDADCLAAGETIPADERHRHLADGANETALTLEPGEHTLCLQAGDGAHEALDLTDEITITVAGASAEEREEDEGSAGPESWSGTYEGDVTWDCGPLGSRSGTLDGTFTIAVGEDGTATMEGENAVTGSCAGPNVGNLTTPITVAGRRTANGFEFPGTLWGPPGPLRIAVDGERGEGTLEGPAPGPAVVVLDFDVECVDC
jgi:hypothetical protein